MDDAVVKLSTTSLIVTLSTSLVFLWSIGLDDNEISHVVLMALLAHFLMRVSIQLNELVLWDATLAVKTIIVLGNDSFDNISVHELLHSHMALGWEA